VFWLQSRSRKAGFQITNETNSPDNLPRNERKPSIPNNADCRTIIAVCKGKF